MTAEVYLDTENLFRGFRPAAQSPEADTVQAELFGAAVADGEDSSIARMRRVVTAVFTWFDQVLREPPTRVSSYGKVWDQGVETFLTVLGENDVESFARVRGQAETDPRWETAGTQGRGTVPAGDSAHGVALEVKPSPALRRALYKWEGVQTIHVHVETGKNKAEEKLARDFLENGSVPGAATRYIIGSGDHDAIYPFDHSCIDHTIKAWVLLPPRHVGVYRKFGEAGSYPHIPAGRVMSLPEVLHQMRVHSNKEAQAVRRAAVKRRQARVSEAKSLHGLAAANNPDAALRHVALVANIDVSQLRGAVPGSAEWRRALGEEWVVDAAESYLPEFMTEAEAVLLAKGRVHARRVGALVRMCILLRAMGEPDNLEIDVIQELLLKLDHLDEAAAELRTLAILRKSAG